MAQEQTKLDELNQKTTHMRQNLASATAELAELKASRAAFLLDFGLGQASEDERLKRHERVSFLTAYQADLQGALGGLEDLVRPLRSMRDFKRDEADRLAAKVQRAAIITEAGRLQDEGHNHQGVIRLMSDTLQTARGEVERVMGW